MTDPKAKKGLSTGVKIAIGCGVLVVLAMIAMLVLFGWGLSKAKQLAEEFEDNPDKAAATMMVRVHPDLDMVSTDDEAGTITFRDNETGEEATMSFEDVAEGRWSPSTGEGEYAVDASDSGEGGVTFTGPRSESLTDASASLEGVPDWVPIYPNATQTQGTYNTQTAEGIIGTINLSTGDSAIDVIDHYGNWFAENGYRVGNETNYERDDQIFAGLTGELVSAGRRVDIGAVEQHDETAVTISYNAKGK